MDRSRLFTSRHRATYGMMELIASPCSWSPVKVLTSITWCPVCCRGMFHKDVFTATESAAILSPAREMMYFTRNKEKLFSICLATCPRKSRTWPLQTTNVQHWPQDLYFPFSSLVLHFYEVWKCEITLLYFLIPSSSLLRGVEVWKSLTKSG